jgi:hypothetical protein
MYQAVMHTVTVPKCAFEIFATLDQLREDISPDPETWPRIYEDQFEEIQEAVDEQAKQFAYGELGECLFPNATTHGTCEPLSELEDVINTVIACEGLFMARDSAVATEQAMAYVIGQLQCMYGNDEAEEVFPVYDAEGNVTLDADGNAIDGCPPPARTKKFKVAKNTFRFSKKDVADDAAKALSRALAKCEECDYDAHPWRLCIGDVGEEGLSLTVNEGSFIPCDAATQTGFAISRELSAGKTEVWVKVEYSSETKKSSELTAITIEIGDVGDAMPADGPLVDYWYIGDVTTQAGAVRLEVTAQTQKLFEDVRLCQKASESNHSWKVTEAEPSSASMTLDVESGKVTAEDGLVYTYAGGNVGGFEGAHVVYLQLNYSGTGGACESIDVGSAATLPPNTATEKYRVIADVVGTTDAEGYQRATIIQRMTEDVVLQSTTARLGQFDLQVDEVVVGSPTTCKVTYKGGTVYLPPALPITITDLAQASICSGAYWLHITRDPESRAAEAAAIVSTAVGASPGTDDYYSQYIFLMEFDLTQEPVYWSQTRTGIIVLAEMMILEQGLIRLTTVDNATRTTYEPPA